MKSDRLTILLVRHGMTKNNLEGRFCGMAQRLGGMLVWRMVLPE